ncbi:thioredoxin-like protein [Gorgonomyces haynaldii]|nr:thioredoxin-like protein [Gorgonomyces haynaldii]
MEDTEWNDILREKGIIPQKQPEGISEDQIIEIVEKTIREKEFGKDIEDRTLDELDELEDLEDDRVLEQYRRMRMEEVKQQLSHEKYGQVLQISKPDYTIQVTEASKTHWVVVHLFQEKPECRLVNAIMDRLAVKYKATKFCKIIADMCIPNYPDKNVPTLLIYGEGDLKRQIIGMGLYGGMSATVESLEQVLRMSGALGDVAVGYKDEDSDEDAPRFRLNRVTKRQEDSDSD